MYDPQAVRRQDITLYRQSGMNDILLNALCINDRQFYVCRNSAYMLRPWL